MWQGEEANHLLGVLEETEPAQFVVGDAVVGRAGPVVSSIEAVDFVCLHQVADNFRAFGDEDPLALAILFEFKLAYEFLLVLCNHVAKLRKNQ